MDAQLKAEWLDALRSGKYKQARYRLRHFSGLCCIGVCYKVKTGRMPLSSWQTVPIATELGLNEGQITDLINMNDFDEMDFAEIADYVEANV